MLSEEPTAALTEEPTAALTEEPAPAFTEEPTAVLTNEFPETVGGETASFANFRADTLEFAPVEPEPAPSPRNSRGPVIITVCCAAAVLIVLIAVFTLMPLSGASVSSAPVATEVAEVTTEEAPAPEAEPEPEPAADVSAEYILPESDRRYYTEEELRNLSIFDMYLARNEIYARHGRIFANQDLIDHFTPLSWYNGTVAPEAFSEGVFNEYERANANLLLSIEQSLNSPYVPGASSSGGQTIYDNEYFSVVIPAGDDPNWWTVTRNPDGSSKFADLPVWVISTNPPGDDNGGSTTITVSDWKLPDSSGAYGPIAYLGQTSNGYYVHAFNEAAAGAVNKGSKTDGADLILH